MVAEGRQDRPLLPDAACPFCPGSPQVPEPYDVLSRPNDFPPLSLAPPPPAVSGTELYPVRPAYGRCEVVLYSPDHLASLGDLPPSQLGRVVDLWAARSAALAQDPRLRYVLVFENRGPEVGVTIAHPHGQIYALPYVPQKLRVELEAFRSHRERTGRCVFCDILAEEGADGRRILHADEDFVAFIPFFTDFPFGAMIAPRRHLGGLAALTAHERSGLGRMLGAVAAGMDELFARPFPYMMAVHQEPCRGGEDFHLHLEFYPPLRGRDRQKYLAAAETGGWAPCNPAAVEGTAPLLRAAVLRVLARRPELA